MPTSISLKAGRKAGADVRTGTHSSCIGWRNWGRLSYGTSRVSPLMGLVLVGERPGAGAMGCEKRTSNVSDHIYREELSRGPGPPDEQLGQNRSQVMGIKQRNT